MEIAGNTLPTTTAPSTDRNAPSTAAFISTPSTSAISTNATSASTGKRKFSFLCGSFEKQNYVYGVKFDKHPWHYFDERDSIRAQHGSLPSSVDESIRRSNGVKTIYVHLNETQSRIYFENGKFIFKNKELKTRNAFSYNLVRNFNLCNYSI